MGQVVEVPAGVIDGINAVFTASVAYQAGSLSVWINGQQVPPPSITETSPATGVFTIADADCIPRTGPWGTDTIAVDYNDTSTDPEVVVIEGLSAVVEDAQNLVGVIDDLPVAGLITDAPETLGALIEFNPAAGVIDDAPTAILGVVEVC